EGFRVGDGTNSATYRLKPTGTHTFGFGLEVANHATLEGCGTVEGDVQVDPGGTVLINCGKLTFRGTLTNNASLWPFIGRVPETQGLLVNNGLLIVQNSAVTNFPGGFINNGTILVRGGGQSYLAAQPTNVEGGIISWQTILVTNGPVVVPVHKVI